MLQPFQGHDELVHADSIISHIIMSLQKAHHVVGIQHRIGRGLRNPLLAQSQNIGKGTDHHQEIAAEAAHLPQ